jgi:hypothetical protein
MLILTIVVIESLARSVSRQSILGARRARAPSDLGEAVVAHAFAVMSAAKIAEKLTRFKLSIWQLPASALYMPGSAPRFMRREF